MNVENKLAELARRRDQEQRRTSGSKRRDPSLSRARRAARGRKRPAKALLIAFALVVLVITAGVAIRNLDRKTAAIAGDDATEVTTTLGELPISATDLFNAYGANEAVAQQEYGDLTLLVSGTVDGVDLNVLNKPVVKLRTSDASMTMQAGLVEASEPKASELSPGDRIELRCAGVSTASGTPVLEKCAI